MQDNKKLITVLEEVFGVEGYTINNFEFNNWNALGEAQITVKLKKEDK